MQPSPDSNSSNPRRVADLAPDDKPREKAIALGVEKLSVSELLAIVLGSGLPGKSVIDLSQEMLQAVGGNLEALARLSIKEMTRKFKGVGPAKAVGLAAALELGRRCHAAAPQQGVQVTSSKVVYDYLRPMMAHLAHEQFRIVVLSRSNRIRSTEVVSVGGTASTVVDVKILIKKAVDALADSIILAHNHPSGNTQPSANDDQLTRRVKEAATLFDIRVLDHIIVTRGGYYSYNDNDRL